MSFGGLAMSAEPHYQINIPAQDVAKALDELAEQTGAITLFPYDLVEGIISKPVKGRYTLSKSLNLMLKNTGLSGGLSDKRVINISVATNAEKSQTNDEEESMSIRKMKKTGIASFFAALIAGSGAAQAQDTNTSAELEEIVVTGIRASLTRAADVKRASNVVVDSITAEGLGKFPDANVADSLSRITGVAVTRTRGGEGQFVTVRGLGEEFNGVTYNGRLIATENAGREFSFDVIASELISGAQVYKTSAAKQGDGSLGGLVNVNSAKPLDNPGFHAAGSVASQYEKLADTFSPNFSGVVSNTWNDDTLGFIASIAYQERDSRTDVADSNFLIFPVDVDSAGNASQGQDGNGDAISDVSGLPLVATDARFNGFSAFVNEQKSERIGGTLAFQYQPSDNFSLLIDGLYTQFENPSDAFGYSFFPSAFSPGFTSNAVLNDSNQIISHDSNAFAYDALTKRNEGTAETIAVGANAEWTFGEDTLAVDVSYSKSDGQRDDFGSASGSGAFFVIGVGGGNVQQRFTGSEVPDFTFNVANPNGPGFIQPQDLVGSDLNLHFGRNDIVEVEDEIVSFKADYELAFSSTSTLSFGADFINRKKVNVARNNAGVACNLCQGYSVPLSSQIDTSELIIGNAPSDFLSDINANIPRQFAFLDLDLIIAAHSAESIRQFGTDLLIPTINDANSTDIDETVIGAYVQQDWTGELFNTSYNANIGLRVSKTDLTSSGAGNTLDDFISVFQAPDGNNQTFVLVPSRAVSIDNDYTEVLPSFNISFDLRDNLLLRGALSKTISRPTLTSLSTSFTLTSQNRGGEAITVNNPQLDPISSNNFDLSLEWYGDNGSSASAAIFYKDISDFVTQVVTTESVNIPSVTEQVIPGGPIFSRGAQSIPFRIQRPENGDDAEILGLELGGQYLVDNGWGVAANVTFTDSEATTAGVANVKPLENISDFSANLAVFYEGERFTGRVAVNNRSEYLVGQTAEGGRDEFVDDFTQVDLSISYVINDSITAFLDGVNILEEPFFRFSETRGLLESYEESGARYVVGVRGKF